MAKELDVAVYLDEYDQPRRDATWRDAYEATQRIRSFFASVNQRFMERDHQIRQMMHAMLLRHHVLMVGDTGGAKTELVDTILSNIEGANVFQVGMTRERTALEVLGPWDLLKIRAGEGYWHMTEGYLPWAHFARLGELFDGGDTVLRSTLDTLHERRLVNGPQRARISLLSVFADTNFAPESMPAREDQLRAFVDRFLFRLDIPYPVDRISHAHILRSNLERAARPPMPLLSLRDIVLASGALRFNNLFVDRYVQEAFVDISRGVSEARVKQGRRPLSPRRMAAAAQCAEIPALFDGRDYVTMDDLTYARAALCMVAADHELFDAMFDQYRPLWIERSKRQEVERELGAIADLTAGVLDVLNLVPNDTPQLQKLYDDLVRTRAAVDAFPVNSVEAHDLRNAKMRLIDGHLEAVQLDLVAKLAARLPTVTTDMTDLNELGRARAITVRIRTELNEVRSLTNRVRDAKAEAINAALHIEAAIEIAWTSGTSPFGAH